MSLSVQLMVHFEKKRKNGIVSIFIYFEKRQSSILPMGSFVSLIWASQFTVPCAL